MLKKIDDKLGMRYDVEGVGLIIFDKNQSIFALSKPKYWIREKNRTLISYGCVGGKVEEGETILEAAKRESYEEISTDSDIISSKETYVIDLDLKVQQIKQKSKINPVVLYYVKYPGVPGDPSVKDTNFIGKVHVFFAILKGKPIPSSEVPAILWTRWDIVQKNIGVYFSLSKFLHKGKLEEQIEIPRNSLLYPMWTPEIISKAFKSNDLKTIFSLH